MKNVYSDFCGFLLSGYCLHVSICQGRIQQPDSEVSGSIVHRASGQSAVLFDNTYMHYRTIWNRHKYHIGEETEKHILDFAVTDNEQRRSDVPLILVPCMMSIVLTTSRVDYCNSVLYGISLQFIHAHFSQYSMPLHAL